MTILIGIGSILLGVITLFLLTAGVMKREHFVRRETQINAPKQVVFDYIKFLKNQDTFNEGAMADTDRKRSFTGTDGTVGYIYAWSGNKDAGEGEKEIKQIVEGKSVETEIRFVKPMKVKATVLMELEAAGRDQTKVSWTNSGVLPYPLNALIPLMQKSVAKQMDGSLLKLKSLLEK